MSVALVAGAKSAWGLIAGHGNFRSSSSSPTHHQSPTWPTTIEQRNLFRHCLYTSELARQHTDDLLKSTTRRRDNLEEIQRHLGNIRSAVDSMLEDHKRFRYGLSENQWKSAKEPITALERLGTSLRVQLEGIDLELKMPQPDPRVLARYGRKIRVLLQDWQKQHRRMGAAIGIKL